VDPASIPPEHGDAGVFFCRHCAASSVTTAPARPPHHTMYHSELAMTYVYLLSYLHALLLVLAQQHLLPQQHARPRFLRCAFATTTPTYLYHVCRLSRQNTTRLYLRLRWIGVRAFLRAQHPTSDKTCGLNILLHYKTRWAERRAALGTCYLLHSGMPLGGQNMHHPLSSTTSLPTGLICHFMTFISATWT